MKARRHVKMRASKAHKKMKTIKARKKGTWGT